MTLFANDSWKMSYYSGDYVEMTEKCTSGCVFTCNHAHFILVLKKYGYVQLVPWGCRASELGQESEF